MSMEDIAQTITTDIRFAAGVSLTMAGAVALASWDKARAFAANVVRGIDRGQEIEREISKHPELTPGEAAGFVHAREQVEAEDKKNAGRYELKLIP